ncbi:MAG TPA: molybdopterin-binding/glycosyltransferase family 2 protein [Rhizomicrobium sp.]|nr:molybdopterin-binding/glycosyltransferase family 2 protein [Rhizomicrobium sp.]
MLFGSVPVESAAGAILAHGLRIDGERFRKGRHLSHDDIERLKTAGIASVTVARLETGDIGEDEAASRIGAVCTGDGARVAAAFTGRVNIYALSDGVSVIRPETVDAVNRINEAITLATVASGNRVSKGQMLATIKIIPFAAPADAVSEAERVLQEMAPAVRVAAFRPMRAALISTFLPDTKPSLLDKNHSALGDRLASLGSDIVFERRVPHEAAALTRAVEEALAAKADPILVFGASAITDRRDVMPAAITAAGGTVDHFGMPVDPGNLLLMARRDSVTVVGLPSCARSPKLNGFDFVLWRILAGLPTARSDIAGMGVGGLLTEIPTRPQPRDERVADVPRSPRVAALVLAAGLSSRMGSNKLLATVDGKPLVRHAVEAAMSSASAPVIVVTGNASATVRAAIAPLMPAFVENPDYSKGLSTSLKSGLRSVPEDADAAMIVLGDMPAVSAGLLDKLIAAFDPAEDRAICVATRHGKRGNPVLFARRFFPEILGIEGDVGARHLIAQYPELVCEVEAGDDGPLTDIDTPEALAEYRAAGVKA